MNVAEYRDWRAAAMREAELQDAVRDIASVYGVLYYHTHDSRRSPSGWPDVVIVGPYGVLFRELKTMKGRVTAAQRQWLDALQYLGADADVWRPGDLIDDTIRSQVQAVSALRKSEATA